MNHATVQEPAVPNTGRILDYWLGGQHHFPIDVMAANAFDAIYDDFPGVFGALRQYIGRASRCIRSQGVDQFLVFGAGLPTCGNVHDHVPDASVLYTDIDPLNVQLGRQILAGVPSADYAYCDASDLATLEQQALQRTLGPIRRLGIVFVGVSAFIRDEKLAQVFAELYEWAPPGSYLALDFDGEALCGYPAALEMLEAAGEPLYMRTPEAIAPLLGPWQLSEDGITPVEAWMNPGVDGQEPAFMYGCLAYRP